MLGTILKPWKKILSRLKIIANAKNYNEYVTLF